jgi:peptidoglycan/xylan/chitin deacetylase (PgdA/CDA1 family)
MAEKANPQRPVIVTTSWDDGHLLDLRLAELLVERGIGATFYIAPRNDELPDRDRLGPAALRDLANTFEIGGHTLTHRRLTTLDESEADGEIRSGKDELEQLIEKSVDSFAYPGGFYRPVHALLVERAGFSCARTVRRGSTAFPDNPFQLTTTLQARQHPRDWPRVAVSNLARPVTALACVANWARLGMASFDRVLASGGVFHLWGHSWEIERFGQWGRLVSLLDHISARDGVRYVTNGGLFE